MLGLGEAAGGQSLVLGHPKQFGVGRECCTEMTPSHLRLCQQPLDTTCPVLALACLLPDLGTVGQWS